MGSPKGLMKIGVIALKMQPSENVAGWGLRYMEGIAKRWSMLMLLNAPEE